MSNCPDRLARQRMHVRLLHAHVAKAERVADQGRVGDVLGARIDREHVACAHLRELRGEPALMARDVDDRAFRDRLAEFRSQRGLQHREPRRVDRVERAAVIGWRDLAARKAERVEPRLAEDLGFGDGHGERVGNSWRRAIESERGRRDKKSRRRVPVGAATAAIFWPGQIPSGKIAAIAAPTGLGSRARRLRRLFERIAEQSPHDDVEHRNQQHARETSRTTCRR